MVEIKEVKTKRQQRDFLLFPIRLYKGCPYYSPSIYSDEKRIFRPDYFYYQSSEAIYFNAYKEGRMVGRIGGIIQHAANRKWKQRRARFTRFDLIDDLEVGKALLEAVESWALSKGMEDIIGPMGFSDLEKEGLLIEGFDEPTTLAENYNHPYYQRILEACGYGKDVDWISHQMRPRKDTDIDKFTRVVNKSMERSHVHYVKERNVDSLIRKYGRKFFQLLEETYSDLYQTVPLLEEQIDDFAKSIKLVLSLDNICFIADENDDLVAFAVLFPHISPILNKTGGRLYPWILPQLLYRLRHSKVLECGLIAVKRELRNSGVSWALVLPFLKKAISGEIEYGESNLTLEDNQNILNLISKFDVRDHRRVRAFIKKLK